MARIITLKIIALLTVAMLAPVSLAHESHDEDEDTDSSSASIVTDTLPMHSLVKNVAGSKVDVDVLIRDDLHHVTIKPSQRASLEQAELFFCFDEELIPWIRQLSLDDKQKCFVNDTGREVENLHVWFNIDYTVDLVTYIVAALSERYPDFAAAFNDNGEQTIAKLRRLDGDISAALRQSAEERGGDCYILYDHDSFWYFEERYSMPCGSDTVSDEFDSPLLVKDMARIGNFLEEYDGTVCVFQDAHHGEGAKMARLLEDNDVSVTRIEMNPLGAEIPAGDEHYFRLLRQLTDAYVQCANLS